MLKNTITIAAFVAQLSIVGFAQEALPKELVLTTESELERTYLPGNIDLRSVPLWEAFDPVLIAARRPGGAVFTHGCEAPAQTLVSIPATDSLASAFDLLTTVYTTHNWSVRDGVVNLLPKGSLPAILDAPIESIAWNTNETAGRSVGRVFDLSTVKRRLAELGITAEMGVGGLQRAPHVFGGPEIPTGRDWEAKNVTLLTALNRIAASYGDLRWQYEERTCGTKTYRVMAEH
jgi:hypothetical protein